MSNVSFTTMGEKCGIASPPDTSVSSTSCVDSHLVPHAAGLTALTEDLAMLDLCMPSLSKQLCDTEEGEVTSSSEIASAFWNSFPSNMDSVYNESEKNPFSVITDEDIHCIQSALSTEEGMQILRQTMMKDLSSGYGGLNEHDLLIESLTESTATEELQMPTMPTAYTTTSTAYTTTSTAYTTTSTAYTTMPTAYTSAYTTAYTDSVSNFEFVRSELEECELRLTGELPSVIPQMYPPLPSDEFYSDVLEVLSSNQMDRRPLFDDDDDDEEIVRPIAIDAAHIDDLVLPDLPPVEDDRHRCEASDLEADDELVLDDNLLQSFSFIDQSYTSNSDNCSSQLDFVFIDDVKLEEDLEKDSLNVGATAEGLRDAATSKQLRRSTRIQENEQREMAERIRQENIQREQEEALRADGRHLEEHERNKRKDSVSSDINLHSGDSHLDLFTEQDEEFLFNGSEKGHSLRTDAQRAGKNIPQKRGVCQKGKGKGRGKGGKAGKASKVIDAWSNNNQTDVSDDMMSDDALLKVFLDETMSDDALLKVEMVAEDDKDDGSTVVPSSDEKSDAQEENTAVTMSTEESDCCPKEQALAGMLSDEKLKAMTKVRLGRLELEAVLPKPITSDAFGAEQERDTAEERVYSKPQTARRRKRKRAEIVCALEPAPDLSAYLTDEGNLNVDGGQIARRSSKEEPSVTVPPEESPAVMLLPLEPTTIVAKPQTARRRKRKRAEIMYALEPTPDYTTCITSEGNSNVDERISCGSSKDEQQSVTVPEESPAVILLPFEHTNLAVQGEKRKESHDESDVLIVKMKKLKNNCENHKTLEPPMMDEVKSNRSSVCEGPSAGGCTEETVAAASHQNCGRKNFKKSAVQKMFSREDVTSNKVKEMKHRSKSSLKDPNSFLDKAKDSKPSQMENCSAQENRKEEKLDEDENKSQLQGKILGKRKADFKDKGIQNQKVALCEKWAREEKEKASIQKEKIPLDEKGDKKAVVKSSRCRGCQAVVQPLSLYCNKSCLLKYAKLVVEELKEKRQKLLSLLSSGKTKSSDKLVLMERSSGKRVTISMDFCETKLLHWLLKHPTYEVRKPNNNQDDNRTKEASGLKLKLKRPMAACTQDPGTKLSDKTSKTQDKVPPSGQDRLLPSGLLTRVASNPEVRQKVDHQRTTKSVSSVRRKPSSSSKSEEKSDKPNASYKPTPVKDGHTMDSSLRRLQRPELDTALSQNSSQQKNGSKSSGTLKGNSSAKPSSCNSSSNKIISGSENKSGSNKSNNNNAVVSRDNQGNNNSSSSSGNKGSNSNNKSNSKGSSGSRHNNSIDNGSSSVSTSRSNTADNNKHGSSSDNRKNSIDSKSSKSNGSKHGSNGSRKGGGSDSKSCHGNASVGESNVVVVEPAEILDTARIDVRTELCSILTSRVNRANDVLMSSAEIKRLTSNIEDELWKSCSAIAGNYKRKYRLVLAYLTDPKNHGLFRKVLCGRVTPSHLLHMSQADKLSHRKNSHKGSKNEAAGSQSHGVAKASTLSMAISDTTSMHGQHVFDVNCRTCTGKSSDLRTKDKASQPTRGSTATAIDISAVNETKPAMELPEVVVSVKVELAEEMDAVDCVELPPVKVLPRDESLPSTEGVVPPWLNTSPVIIPKNSPRPGSDLTDPRDRTRVIPRTSSLVRIKRYASSLFASDAKTSTGFIVKSDVLNDIEGRPEDLQSSSSSSSSSGSRVWNGNIFAQDVALVAVDAYHLSGSMKFVKSLLPESLTVMGRLEPDVVYEYLTKLKTCYSATKEIAVVCFRASNDPNSSLYSLLYAYLHQRHRCGVIGSIGTAIKDMYIVPLPAKAPIPDILLPDIGPVLERGRDLLLGVIVQQTSRAARLSRSVSSRDSHSHPASHEPAEVKLEPVTVGDFDEKSVGLNNASSETGNNRASESSDSDSLDVDGSDVIICGYSKAVPAKPAEQKTDLAAAVDVKCEKGPAVDDGDEPYDPFDEEEEQVVDTEAAVVKMKPAATSSSSSSPILPASSASLSSNKSCTLNESLASLTAVLSTMTNFPVPATLLATLATQAATPPNLEGLTKLAIILSGQMNALKQEHIPHSESAVVISNERPGTSVKREDGIDDDDDDCDSAKMSDGSGLNKDCDVRLKQSDTANDEAMFDGEKPDCAVVDVNVGIKSELVGVKNQNDRSTASGTGSCRDDAVKTDGSSTLERRSFRFDDAKSFEGHACKSESGADDNDDDDNDDYNDDDDDGGAASKTSLSTLQVVNVEFSHMEEDDNEDHLVIDLDSPISEEDAFDTKHMGKSDSWHSRLTTTDLGNNRDDVGPKKININTEVVDGIELFGGGDREEEAAEASKSKSRMSALLSTAVDHPLLPENVDNLQSGEATGSPLFSPSDQDNDDGQDAPKGIFDAVSDEDLFSCKSFGAMQDAYAYESAVQDNIRDAERQEQMESTPLKASLADESKEATLETSADNGPSSAVVEDSLKLNYAKDSSINGSMQKSVDAFPDAGDFSKPHCSRIPLVEEDGSENASHQLQSSSEERSDESVQKESDHVVELMSMSPAAKTPADDNDVKYQSEENEAFEVTAEVAPLPAPPRPPDRLLQSLKSCPLPPQPLLQRPPSPKTLLANPFGFHSMFNPNNKPPTCFISAEEEILRDQSSMGRSNAATRLDSFSSEGPQDFPKKGPGGTGPLDILQGPGARLENPGGRTLSMQQQFLDSKCRNGIISRYNANSPSFADLSGLLKVQRPAYHDSDCAGEWMDGRTPVSTPPPASRSWKSTTSDTIHLPGSDCSEETNDSVQLAMRKSSFGRKMAEPASMEQSYLSTDDEQSGAAAYRMRRQQPLSGGGLLGRCSSTKEIRSLLPLESCNKERGIAHARTDPEKGRRKSDGRYELERTDQKMRLDGRYNADKGASVETEYTRSWSNERRFVLSPLCPPGFSDDHSASSSSRGSLLHFRGVTPKPFPAAAPRPRPKKDNYDERGGRRGSPRVKCVGESSGECPRPQPERSGSRLLNAEMSWSEIVSRRESTSGRDAVRARRPSRTSVAAEEGVPFHDLDERFHSDVDYPVSNRQHDGSAWLEMSGREDWRRNNASAAGDSLDCDFRRKKEEGMSCGSYSQGSEVKRWERTGEEEQEEGEYVDDQGGDSSEAFGLAVQPGDGPDYFPPMKSELSRLRSCSVSSALLLNADCGENSSSSCVVNNGKFASKLREVLRVEIDPPSDAGNIPPGGEEVEEELEDGEITDPSPPLAATHGIPPLLDSYSSDVWAKDFLAKDFLGSSSRRLEKSSVDHSGISSRRLLERTTVQPYVPHSRKQKPLDEPEKRFRRPPSGDHDDRLGVASYSSLLRPSYDRYIPHQHQQRSSSGSSSSRMLPDRRGEDSCQRLSNLSSSGGSFWNATSSGRATTPRDRPSSFYPPA